jgi:hypothetical protein
MEWAPENYIEMCNISFLVSKCDCTQVINLSCDCCTLAISRAYNAHYIWLYVAFLVP